MGRITIPVDGTEFNGNEKKYLSECIDERSLADEGSFVARFEGDVASYVGAKCGVAVSSGTAALEASFFAAGILPEDEVVLPSFSSISCVLAVLRCGAVPILTDIDPDTLCVNVDLVKKKVTRKTKAVIAVHACGYPVDMEPLLVFASKNGLQVIEDVSEAFGSEYKDKKCGGMGTIGCMSFSRGVISTGEGGMVVTSNERIAGRVRSYKDLCRGEKRKGVYEDLGANYRITNLQAALGCAQLEKVSGSISAKRRIAALYEKMLTGVPGIKLLTEKEWAKCVYCMYPIALDESTEFDGNGLASELREEGIETSPFLVGLHEQPILKKMGFFKNDKCPVTGNVSRRGLYLPSGITLKEKEIESVTQVIKDLLR